MKNIQTITTMGGLLLTAAVALAQVTPTAPPPPPAPPAISVDAPTPAALPMRAPRPAALPPMQVRTTPSPAPVAAPAPPAPPEYFQDFPPVAKMDWDKQQKAMEKVQDALDKAQFKMNLDVDQMQQQAMEKVQDALGKSKYNLDFDFKVDTMVAPKSMTLFGDLAYATAAQAYKTQLPYLAQPARALTISGFGGKGSDEGLYNNGLSQIDAHQYDQALASFNIVVSHAGARTEGALYWKAYVLNKLGKASEAQAAIDQLRKSYTSSRWLDDAKVLELEVKQSKGPVSPEAETDEDIKILALNSLMQSDPEHALPQVENLLKTSHSPKLKRNAVQVIAMNGSPRAKQDLEQIAKGSNPDLQLAAIRSLSSRRGDNSNGALFAEIYAGSTDKSVKMNILNAFKNTKDKDHLVQILKSEKDPDLRNDVIRALGDVEGQPELWQIFPQEATAEGKINLLNAMQQNGNVDKLTEVARTDKDPKVRQQAIRTIATQKAGNPGATIAAIYSSEQDENVKSTIVNNLANMRNVKALIDIARVEKDVQLKYRIVQHIANMSKTSKEASDYMQELLSK